MSSKDNKKIISQMIENRIPFTGATLILHEEEAISLDPHTFDNFFK